MNTLDKELLKTAGKIAAGVTISVIGYSLDNGGEVSKPLGYIAYGGGIALVIDSAYMLKEKAITGIRSHNNQNP